jgi:hypothetical protein
MERKGCDDVDDVDVLDHQLRLLVVWILQS